MQKKILEDINRLKIISLLIKEQKTFSELKETLSLTDGNLSSHLKKLYLKQLISINKKKISIVSITKKGKIELEKHILFLEEIIKGVS